VAHNDFDQDSDWTSAAEQAAAQPSRRPQQIALVVFGIALGAAGASAAWFVASKASAPPVVVSAPAPVAQPPAAPPAAPALVAAPVAAPVVQPPDDEVPAAPPVASVPRPTLSAAEVARRKELAWSRFYKRPSTCEGNPTAEQLIDCANHFIRAKREFDERWRTGNL